TYCLRGILLPTLLIMLLFTDNALSSDEAVEVITHPGTDVSYLSKNLLRSVFSMRLRSWQDGVPIRVFVLPDDAPLHSIFAKKKLNV
ncbi:hypothetical protein ACXWOF_09680, partial [Streptococcus pyogenes]